MVSGYWSFSGNYLFHIETVGSHGTCCMSCPSHFRQKFRNNQMFITQNNYRQSVLPNYVYSNVMPSHKKRNSTILHAPINFRAKSAQMVTLVTSIVDVFGSNLGSETEYPDWKYSWISQVPLRKGPESTLTRHISLPIHYSSIMNNSTL
jgi:hypothetical protein